MKVIWHKRAKRTRGQVADYVGQNFGRKRKMHFLQEVRQMTQTLKHSPNIGKIDPLFDDMPIAYRSVIINGLSKMVYYVEDNTVYIAAFWDTRVDADQQSRLLK